jgi:hypothetical protein
MADYIHLIWNSPNHVKSPYKYFGGVLIPKGKDPAGNVIYMYDSQWERDGRKVERVG